MSAGEIFKKCFDSIQNAVPFDHSWKNGTGYFDHATNMIELPAGELAKSTDDFGRRIILVGTRFGTVVVFDRYKNQSDGGVYVSNIPDKGKEVFDLVVSKTSISEWEMRGILGNWDFSYENLGSKIERAARLFK